MKTTLKKNCLCLLTLLLIWSCNTPTPGNDADLTNQENNQTNQTTDDEIHCISLPDMEFDMDDFGMNGITDGKELSAEEIIEFQIQKIYSDDTDNTPDLKYFLLKTMYEGENGKVLLISQEYQMWITAWLVIYEKDNSLKDFKEIFFDEFAEGFTYTTAAITNNEIRMEKYNFDPLTEKETKDSLSYCISENLVFNSLK